MALRCQSEGATGKDEKKGTGGGDRNDASEGLRGGAFPEPRGIAGRRLQPRKSYAPGTYEAMALWRITCLSNPKLGITALLITFVIVPCGEEERLRTNDVSSGWLSAISRQLSAIS